MHILLFSTKFLDIFKIYNDLQIIIVMVFFFCISCLNFDT